MASYVGVASWWAWHLLRGVWPLDGRGVFSEVTELDNCGDCTTLRMYLMSKLSTWKW